MDTSTQLNNDRIRNNTPFGMNEKIDRKTEDNIYRYSRSSTPEIQERLYKLDKEWDVERSLQLTSAISILAGVLLSAKVSKKWLWLSGLSAAFLAQHTIQGWCPTLPLLRYFGIRTKEEINREKTALGEEIDDLMLGERMYQGGY
jgi:hypothetical protein